MSTTQQPSQPSMQATYALTQPILTIKDPAVLDLLIRFRADLPDAGDGTQAPPQRRPLNLSVVIDRSGSMSGKPLKQAIQASELLVRQLEPRDTLSVVVYDNTVKTIVEPQKVADPEDICKKLRKVKTGGSTNLSGGWSEGCKHVLQLKNEPLIHRVLLLTDGQANAGVTAPKKLIELARDQAEKGAVTTTLGFGKGFNEDLLIGMAEAAGGNFYFIETPEDASQVFQIEGESLASLAAQNLTVTLTPREGSGVKVREVINGYPSRPGGDGLQISVGDVYGGEDKLLALEVEVPPQAKARRDMPLFDVTYTYDPVAGADDKRGGGKAAGRIQGMLSVTAGVANADEAKAAPVDPDVLRQVSRIRIAKAKEAAVALADEKKYAEAGEVLRTLAAELRKQGLEEEFEIAEEIAQLEHFAETIEKKQFDTSSRKTMRDQSYQGRTRARADLSGRGSSGGSAATLETADSAAGGVELACVREGGKLRVQVVSPGYEPDFNVQFPRGIREEGAHYVVDSLQTSKNGTFYRAAGKIRRLTKPSKTTGSTGAGAAGGASASAATPSDPGDPLALAELFQGGGEPWMPLLKPVIEAQPDAPMFIGPQREKSIVPVRELTFQALKPNPPEKWKVVIFGQNPYPRVESATGIAMFDNTFGNWKDSQFGKVTSIRCIIKAATIWKHGIKKATPIADIRALLDKHQTVQPPEWFQAMLTQGVLLLNAALTASSDGSLATNRHTAFWRPVVEKLVEEILKSKQQAGKADEHHKGVVFGWWGTHAKALRKVVEKLQKQYPGVPVRHIDHPNPAAQGDIFCDGNHFADVNAALKSLGMDEVDWLPAVGWNKPQSTDPASANRLGDADRMGDFITKTMELHKFYLERLAGVKDEAKEALPAIVGVLATPMMKFAKALTPLAESVPGLDYYAKRSQEFGGKTVAAAGGLSEDEIAALYLYTTESVFYRKLNATLREPDRAKVTPYFPYLRLLFSALDKLTAYTGSLWRGVSLDLRPIYPKGRTITWWGVSSCTSKRSVATGFMGATGRRTLFEVIPAKAVSIRKFSAFTGEDEYVLAPGAQLKVVDVQTEKGGLSTVKLQELAGQRLVS